MAKKTVKDRTRATASRDGSVSEMMPAVTTSKHLNVNRKKKSHRKMYAKWSEEEKDALLQGVVTYGVGQWRAIKEDPRFAEILMHRSNVDCKDKWRQSSTPTKTARRTTPLSPELEHMARSPDFDRRVFQNAANLFPGSPVGLPSSQRAGIPSPRRLSDVMPAASPARPQPSPARPQPSPMYVAMPDSDPDSTDRDDPFDADDTEAEARKRGCSIM